MSDSVLVSCRSYLYVEYFTEPKLQLFCNSCSGLVPVKVNFKASHIKAGDRQQRRLSNFSYQPSDWVSSYDFHKSPYSKIYGLMTTLPSHCFQLSGCQNVVESRSWPLMCPGQIVILAVDHFGIIKPLSCPDPLHTRPRCRRQGGLWLQQL